MRAIAWTGFFLAPSILLCAASLALMTGQRTDMLIILVIVLGSGLLGFWPERNAADAVLALLAQVRIKTTDEQSGAIRVMPAISLGIDNPHGARPEGWRSCAP